MNRPTPMLDVFAWIVRGRVSNLRGLAAVAAGVASCVGPWPLVVWRCYRLGAWYTRHVLVSLLSAPVLLWALHLRGFNARVELVTPDLQRKLADVARTLGELTAEVARLDVPALDLEAVK